MVVSWVASKVDRMVASMVESWVVMKVVAMDAWLVAVKVDLMVVD